MKSLEELKASYRKRLRDFPFESPEEALALGMTEYVLAEPNEYRALDSPYIMKAEKVHKISTADSKAEYVEEESSDSVSSGGDPFYGDIYLDNIDLFVAGRQILDGASVVIQRNRKYGLIGRNGIGKTTLLKAISKRKFGISRGLKIHKIKQDYVSDEKVIDFVGPDAGIVLSGLGFSKEMQQKTLRELSGGWRMRAQIAKAVHLDPDLLLLDEPTNFLDVKAIGYLEAKIKSLKTVIIVSHDRNFLNNTTEMIWHMSEMKIDTYRGNYASFCKQRADELVTQTREYDKQLADRQHLQDFIDRFRYNAKRASLVQSKLKILDNMPVLLPPKIDPSIKFSFDCTKAQGMLLELSGVSFGYGEKSIFREISLSIDINSRFVIVGRNGQGKSTLLKLLSGRLAPTGGRVESNPLLRPGYFAQHHVDHLDHNEHTLSLLMKRGREEESRKALARFGLSTGNQKIGTLSGGQKSRLAFSLLNLESPNLLLLDEPTNHLDIETIEALADALREYKGAVVCVSHDVAFIEKVFNKIFICEEGVIGEFRGTLEEYKQSVSH